MTNISAVSATVGANVKAEMARRDVTQSAVGVALGVPQSSVSQRLSGTIHFTISELAAVAALLGVSIDRLLEGVDPSALASAASA